MIGTYGRTKKEKTKTRRRRRKRKKKLYRVMKGGKKRALNRKLQKYGGSRENRKRGKMKMELMRGEVETT